MSDAAGKTLGGTAASPLRAPALQSCLCCWLQLPANRAPWEVAGDGPDAWVPALSVCLSLCISKLFLSLVVTHRNVWLQQC